MTWLSTMTSRKKVRISNDKCENLTFDDTHILSREANIDIEDFGILLKDNTIEEIIDVVEDVSQKSAEWCKERARLVVKEINENYTEDKFLQNMKRAIWTVMQKKDKDISEDMGCL